MTLPEGVTWADMIGTAEAALLLRGRLGKPPCRPTIRLWINKGYKPAYAPESARVFLKAIRHGQDYCTTKRWCEEFVAAQLAASLNHQPQPKGEQP